MQDLIELTQRRGCTVAEISTDALKVIPPKGVQLSKLFADQLAQPKGSAKEEWSQIGKLRIEASKKIKSKKDHTFRSLSSPFKLYNDTTWEWDFKPKHEAVSAISSDIDEWDRTAMADAAMTALQVSNRLIWLSTYPGCGKTECSVQVQQRLRSQDVRTLNVVAYHKARSMLSEKGIDPADVVTAHFFFKVDSCDRDKGGMMDITDYKAVHFEEIFLLGDTMINRIYRFALSSPDVIVTATGDPYQIPPIGDFFSEYANYEDVREARTQRVLQVFSSKIELQIAKFLQPVQMERLVLIKQMLFNQPYKNESFHIRAVALHFFGPPIKDPFVGELSVEEKARAQKALYVTQHIITKSRINRKLASVYTKKDSSFGKIKVEKGQKLTIVRPFGTLQKSDQMIVVDTYGKYVLENVYTKETVEIAKEEMSLQSFWHHFDLAYAVTVHSSQGSRTQQGQRAIGFDVGSPFMDIACFWVMLTRDRNLDCFKYVADKGTEIKHVKADVQRQVQQHIRTVGAIDGELKATVEAIIAKLKAYRFRCPGIRGEPCNVDLFDDNLRLHFHIDREEADLGMTPENCRPRCEHCNLSKAKDDHIDDDIEDTLMPHKKQKSRAMS